MSPPKTKQEWRSSRAFERHYYGDWNGKEGAFRDAVDRAFVPIIPGGASGHEVLRNRSGARYRTADLRNYDHIKHVADLFLIRTA
jgi:hypothetical protein